MAEKNVKAEKFEEYCNAHELNCFGREDIGDENGTVLFRSYVQAENRTLALIIITDTTIYTIVRLQMAEHLANDENRAALTEYVNEVNRRYKVFKYILSDAGDVFLDACIPCTGDFFDPQLVHVVLDVVVSHVQEEYAALLAAAGLAPSGKLN